jgi:Golgi apparatus protein 1
MQAAEAATSRKMGPERPALAAAAPAGAGSSAPPLSEGCRVLAEVAAPPSMQRAFDASLSVALLESQLASLEAKTGLSIVKRDPHSGKAQALTLTGWSAVAGIAAVVLLALAGAAVGYKRYRGVPLDSTTVVLKSRPRYNRVGSGSGASAE